MIQAKPLARDLFVSWTRQNDPDALKKYYFTTGNPAAAAEVLVKESYQVGPQQQTIDPSTLLQGQEKWVSDSPRV